jgi:DNA-binding NarL/FixJ family response regulator
VGAARVILAAVADVDEAARQHVDRATELLARWGGWRAEELAAVRRLLPPDDDSEAGTLLTRREWEVAQLVADGLTNAELAKRLFISPRTAAVHVSSILRKLDVPSRTDVAAALRSAGQDISHLK